MRTVHRWSSATPMPWKNGGGVTRELARRPSAGESGRPEGFDWRLSVADVTADGPFSLFPGVDRILVLLSGAGMDLHFTDDDEIVSLRLPLGAHRFPGEARIHAVLPGGPTTDLNLMWQRNRFDASMRVLETPVGYDPVGRPMLVFVADGAPALADDTLLAPGDVVVTDEGVSLVGHGIVVVFVLDPR